MCCQILVNCLAWEGNAKKQKLLSCNFYLQVCGDGFLTGVCVHGLTWQGHEKLQSAAQPSAWDPLQFKQGCNWNWLLLSLGLIHTSRVHYRGFIPSLGFRSGPAPHPGLGQSLHIALHTVGVPVVVCSIGVAWRNSGHQIKRNCVEFAFFVPSLAFLLLTSVLQVNSPLVLWHHLDLYCIILYYIYIYYIT